MSNFFINTYTQAFAVTTEINIPFTTDIFFSMMDITDCIVIMDCISGPERVRNNGISRHDNSRCI